MSELYVGVMSGTSLDGVDTALLEIDADSCTLLHARTTPFPAELGATLGSLVREARASLPELGRLDVAFATFAAECVLALIEETSFDADDVVAIGFSGHTIFHQPEPPQAFTLQLGNPNVLAANTGITTVADLRGMDVAVGGQGAPLLPAFHAWRFADHEECRVAVNIGGIANLTCLDPQGPVAGFDSGPGNALMDAWSRRTGHGPFDRGGAWAATGTMVADLLQTLRSDPYFAKSPPKSTGLEHFNLAWLEKALSALAANAAEADVQATLLELTASTIADAVATTAPHAQRLILCGGGAYNAALVARLAELLPSVRLESSAAHGIDPQWVEAAGFAWLARARLRGIPGNVPSVTGAREPVLLGGVYSGRIRQA